MMSQPVMTERDLIPVASSRLRTSADPDYCKKIVTLLCVALTNGHYIWGDISPNAGPATVILARGHTFRGRLGVIGDWSGIFVIWIAACESRVASTNAHSSPLYGGPVAVPSIIPLTNIGAFFVGFSLVVNRSGFDVKCQRCTAGEKGGQEQQEEYGERRSLHKFLLSGFNAGVINSQFP